MRGTGTLLVAVALLAGCIRGRVVRDGRVDDDRLAATCVELSRLRGLALRAPVPAQVLGHDAMRAALARQIELSYRPGDLEHLQAVYIRLGLLPAGTDLPQALHRMYAEEAAGFYDPRAKELVLAGDALGAGGLGLRLVSFVSGRDPVGEFFLAHELTHALQDQHYGLPTEPEPLLNADGDRLLARRALLEGDATLTGFAYVVRQPLDAATVAPLAPQLATIPAELATKHPELPPLLAATLAFQYVDGAAFTTAALAAGGRPELDRVHRDPPRSTEQVLHPERYFGARQDPVAITIGGTEVLEANGWTAIVDDTVGEFETRMLARRFLPGDQADRVADGWGGARLRALARGDALVLVWMTAWDSPAEATEFTDALVTIAPEARGERRAERVLVLLGPADATRVDLEPLAARVWAQSVVANPS